MPEYDVTVLVPVKMRLEAQDERHIRNYGPQIIGDMVAQRFTTDGLYTLHHCRLAVSEFITSPDTASVD